MGLVAYACDAASGKIGDSALRDSLAAHAQIYCDSAFIVIFEESEFMSATIDDYLDELIQQAESDRESSEDPDRPASNSTAVDIEEAKAKLQEASELAKKAKSQARSGQYYVAAKSLDSASKLLESQS
jgi:hypothetical protein